MYKLIKGIAAASLLTIATGGFAVAQSPTAAFEHAATCNTNYAQCLQGANNISLAPTPTAGMEQMRANFENSTACASALQACYSSN